ncbi:MAG: cysteine hydrolase [Proteobacteria bacterium]|nr:cysteine hydrolase [Pseudomonadota bacterium]
MHKIEIPAYALERIQQRRGRFHQFDALDPKRTAHVVVDLQNGFMAPGQVGEVPIAREIVPNVNRVSQALRAAGGLVVYIQNTIDDATRSGWSNWATYFSTPARAARMNEAFKPGSYGHAIWDGLEVLPEDLKVLKRRFGAFVPGASDLHEILQARGINTVIITGTVTNVCCESTARDAMMMNYKVVFVSDGNAAFTDAEHNATLGNMAMLFADVMTTDEVAAKLAGTRSQAAE